MTDTTRRAWCAAAMAGAASTLLPRAMAQGSFPSKPVTVLVGFTAGGPVDVTTRTIGEPLGRLWSQPVIVDVRPGANGTAAAALLAKAPADGSTLLMATRSITMNAALYTKLPYDPARAFVPVGIAATQPNVLVVSQPSGLRTLDDVLRKARAAPGTLTYASTGNGSIPHLAGEMFQKLTGTQLVHVPYKGGSSLIIDLMAGRVDMSFAGLGTVIGHMDKGQVVPIGVASDQRSTFAPQLPTFAEQGVAGFNVDTWYGLLAPAGTPPQVVARINADLNQVLATPEVQARLNQGGSSVAIVSPQEFRRRYDDDLDRYGKLIRGLGLKLD